MRRLRAATPLLLLMLMRARVLLLLLLLRARRRLRAAKWNNASSLRATRAVLAELLPWNFNLLQIRHGPQGKGSVDDALQTEAALGNIATAVALIQQMNQQIAAASEQQSAVAE